jgi:DNA-binding response OmpR family regulator
MTEKKKRILCIEDNVQLQKNHKRILPMRGYDVHLAYSLDQAWQLLKAYEMPDVILLDIRLEDGSGLDFLKEFKDSYDIPVLLLTAMGKPQDIASGLELGADDYLSKPFHYDVLIARIENLLRRASRRPTRWVLGDLELDLASAQAYLGNTDLSLTQKEFQILLVMSENSNQIMSAEALYERIWKQPMVHNSNALWVQIANLKRKLKAADSRITIEGIRGMGYQLLV